jgi:hypothetical protein
MNGRWLFAVSAKSDIPITPAQLRRFANRTCQPDLVSLAVADSIESDNLVHLYRTNDEWAQRLNAAVAAIALLKIERKFNIQPSSLNITAQYITEHDTTIS